MAAEHGGEFAFERTFFEFYPRVVGLLSRMLGDRDRAEEVASDAFIKLAGQRVPAGGYENVGGWLYRTATRLALNALRSASRRERYEHLAARDPDSAADPLETVLRVENSLLVQAALSRLKPAEAQLLMLRSQGLPYKDIASALGLKPTSVGTMLARAEAAFEKAYQGRAGLPACRERIRAGVSGGRRQS